MITYRIGIVRDGNVLSGQVPVTSGVPQRSALGAYVFELTTGAFSHDSDIWRFVNYADDTTLCFPIFKAPGTNQQMFMSRINWWIGIQGWPWWLTAEIASYQEVCVWGDWSSRSDTDKLHVTPNFRNHFSLSCDKLVSSFWLCHQKCFVAVLRTLYDSCDQVSPFRSSLVWERLCLVWLCNTSHRLSMD